MAAAMAGDESTAEFEAHSPQPPKRSRSASPRGNGQAMLQALPPVPVPMPNSAPLQKRFSMERRASLEGRGRRSRFQELVLMLEQEHEAEVQAAAGGARGLSQNNSPKACQDLPAERRKLKEEREKDRRRKAKIDDEGLTVGGASSLMDMGGAQSFTLPSSRGLQVAAAGREAVLCGEPVPAEFDGVRQLEPKFIDPKVPNFSKEFDAEKSACDGAVPSKGGRAANVQQLALRRSLQLQEMQADEPAVEKAVWESGSGDDPSYVSQIASEAADGFQNRDDGFWRPSLLVEEIPSKRNSSFENLPRVDKFLTCGWAYPAKQEWIDVPEHMNIIAHPSINDVKKAKAKSGPQMGKSLSTLDVGKTTCTMFYSRPTSPFRVFWCITACAFLFFDLISLPMMLFDPPSSTFLIGVKYSASIFWVCDIPVSFTTGFFDKNGCLEMRPKVVACHYLRTWCALDVSIVLIDWIVFLLERGTSNVQGLSRIGRSLRTVRFLSVLRLLRLAKVSTFLDLFQDMFGSASVNVHMNMAQIVMFILIINHFIACGWYGMGNLRSEGKSWIKELDLTNRPLTDKYVASYYWSLGQFGIGQVDYGPTNVVERTFAIGVLLFALVTFSSLVSSITNAMSAIRDIKSGQTVQFGMVRRYLKQNSIGRDLAQRILKHIEFTAMERKRKIQVADVELFRYLTEPLQNEMKMEIHAPHFTNHALLVRLLMMVPTTMHRVCGEAIRNLSLASEDQLFANGEEAKSVYILILEAYGGDERGRAYYSRHAVHKTELAIHKTEVKTNPVKELKLIAEATFWTNWVHCGDLVAHSRCDFVAIDPDVFAKHIRSNTSAFFLTQSYCRQFLQVLNTIVDDDVDGEKSDLDQEYVYHPRYSSKYSALDEDMLNAASGQWNSSEEPGFKGRGVRLLRNTLTQLNRLLSADL